MDGMALAQEARRRRPGLPVLLTTGYTGAGALEAPADLPLLRKPYRLDELAVMLDRVLAPRSTEAA
jgi:DNA-binding NtrC family response regulator